MRTHRNIINDCINIKLFFAVCCEHTWRRSMGYSLFSCCLVKMSPWNLISPAQISKQSYPPLQFSDALMLLAQGGWSAQSMILRKLLLWFLFPSRVYLNYFLVYVVSWSGRHENSGMNRCQIQLASFSSPSDRFRLELKAPKRHMHIVEGIYLLVVFSTEHLTDPDNPQNGRRSHPFLHQKSPS